ncbi:unnamed protein product [Spirodela intermedia]|uniref:Uncharacterized protein n=1 Tax=Spirodela intermedia TaxID=51605 RepID=A0A7I8L460_SPIIN|nr:unnamed protein product [Spirodela intermedia]
MHFCSLHASSFLGASGSIDCLIQLFSLFIFLDESKGTEVSVNTEIKKSESDRLVDSMDFGELCNDFVCVSSPYVEATARQLARDILEQREGNRALGSFSATVKYKDPIRSFIGREKYKRSSWSSYAIENPSVTVQEMMMQSTSVLSIKWTIKGKPKNIVVSSIGGDLVLLVNSRFTLNQISGQVIEHEESWDLSSSSIIGQAYFWASRTLYSAIQAGNDTMDSAKKMTKRLSPEKENTEIFPDPLGDPTKFFQRDEGLQRDVYQIALFLAVIYFVVQFLKLTL